MRVRCYVFYYDNNAYSHVGGERTFNDCTLPFGVTAYDVLSFKTRLLQGIGSRH